MVRNIHRTGLDNVHSTECHTIRHRNIQNIAHRIFAIILKRWSIIFPEKIGDFCAVDVPEPSERTSVSHATRPKRECSEMWAVRVLKIFVKSRSISKQYWWPQQLHGSLLVLQYNNRKIH